MHYDGLYFCFQKSGEIALLLAVTLLRPFRKLSRLRRPLQTTQICTDKEADNGTDSDSDDVDEGEGFQIVIEEDKFELTDNLHQFI